MAATGPLQLIRQPVDSAVPGRDAENAAYEDGWARVCARQAAIPAALDGYAHSLLLAAERGHPPTRRQVELVTPLAVPPPHDAAPPVRTGPRNIRALREGELVSAITERQGGAAGNDPLPSSRVCAAARGRRQI
ncbi:hypothetical protein AB0F68_34285 [Micromonospora sp. NPDC023966]|uniref:hypothetical protein n=1 Tax=Micromonospora sp. NPDC023966 TaxID=3154699 RepID=UPI0033C96799